MQCRVQVEAATQLDPQVHQRLSAIERKSEEGGREKVKEREGVFKKETMGEERRGGETEGGRR